MMSPMSKRAQWSRDAHGIPQIAADDVTGLLWGMGYCHAMDRGLQMLFMRILGWGRTSELLADDPETLEVDRFFRKHNFGGSTEEETRNLDAEVLDAVEAYCDGVNARLSESVPIEFKLVGYKPDAWTPADCLMLARMTGFLTLAQSQGEVERLFVEMVQAGVGDEHLEALFAGSTQGLDRELLEQVTLGERIVPESVRWAAGSMRMMASNNWCLSGAKTKSGSALLANDPHLETNRLPNVWVEQSFRWPDGYGLMATMPGLPAPLVGRTEHLAWGATYTFMDAIDSWIEECRGGKYRRLDDWRSFEVRTETITRKKNPPVTQTYFENEHGVLDGDATKDGFYLATRWSGAGGGAASINALHRMWTATTVDDGMAAFAELESSFNWIFADSSGDIGYQMSGRLPKRPDDWNGFSPRPGWDPAYDWDGFVPQAELPACKNPDDGVIVTANQDLNHLGAADPINMPMGDYRARRIRRRLEARDDHDVESTRALQFDVFSLQAKEFFEVLEPLLEKGPVANALRTWDFQYGEQSRGATAFEIFYAQLLREMFSAECGAPVIEHLQDATGIFIDFYQNFDRVLLAEDSPWLGERTREDVWLAALRAVANEEVEPWGQRNQITLTNMFFGGKLPEFLGFDHGPFPLRGGRATPHQGQIYHAGARLTSFAPSLRFAVDLSEPDLHSALCGGPSDRRTSKYYTSGVRGWRAGRLKRRKPPQ